MHSVTKEMIRKFQIMDVGIDFMGYEVSNKGDLSFHHLILPRKTCKRIGVPEDGYLFWNGAILVKDESHEYLHLIERVDRDLFEYLTNEMIDMNLKKYLDIKNLKNIRDALVQFEREHQFDEKEPGKKLIKESYIKNRMIK